MRRASRLHRVVLCCVASRRIASHRIPGLFVCPVARWLVSFARSFSFFSHLSPFGTRSARRQTLQSSSSPSHSALPTRLGTYPTRQTPHPSNLLSSSVIPSRQVSTSRYMPRCYNTPIRADHGCSYCRDTGLGTSCYYCPLEACPSETNCPLPFTSPSPRSIHSTPQSSAHALSATSALCLSTPLARYPTPRTWPLLLQSLPTYHLGNTTQTKERPRVWEVLRHSPPVLFRLVLHTRLDTAGAPKPGFCDKIPAYDN
ncbi:hypothetical protein F5Y14DRAFT_159720 [Nemania sp. NC0429]|nr:hypothetical protein F5Y14DRAFT_159720 [Nemania sp. NC0429]